MLKFIRQIEKNIKVKMRQIETGEITVANGCF